MTDSPLTIPTPDSIDLLFSRLPSEITQPELAALVARLRADRTKWQVKEAVAASKKSTKEERAAEKAAALANLPSIDDLEV